MADAAQKPTKPNNDKLIERMCKRFKLAAEAESENRKNGLKALKFRSGGKYQWDDKLYAARTMDNRPTESNNQIPQFVHKVTNNMRMNMPQVKIIPKEDAVKETADILEGMCREIQSSSEAEVAFDTAADLQVTIGWGYFRVLTEYEDEEDESEDQVIKIKRIANPMMVYDDPYALEQDRSDRDWAFIANDLPVDEFNLEHDKNYGDLELSSIGDQMPGWASTEARTVRVVEYFERTREKLDKVGNKERYRSKVMWYKCTATEVLESAEWAGKYIPLIFVSGEELNIDGKKELSGIVEGLIAPQKQYNYWTNAATEAVALAPKSPFIMALGQVKGLEKYWDNANAKSYPYLPYHPIDINGTPIGPPQRQSPGADISAFIALVQGAQQNMYSVSGIYPASLGQQSNETSGRAINARKVEGEVSNFHFPDNMARAIRFLGRILVDLIPKIYDTKRVVRILHMDGKTEAVTVNAPFKDKKGKSKTFDLSEGKYDVAVTTGPSYSTKREQAVDSMIQISQANPAIWQVAPDLMVKEMDWPGSDKLAERFAKTLPPGLVDDDEASEIPPQVQAQVAQMQQIIEQLGTQLQQASQELQSKEAEIQLKQADLQLKAQDMQYKAQHDQMQAQLDMDKNQLEREKLAVETLKIELSGVQEKMPKAQGSSQSETIEHEPDGLENENVLLAKIDALREKREKEAMDMQMMQEMAMQEQALQVQTAEMQMQQQAAVIQNAQATQEQLGNISMMLGGLMQAITAPKVVQRDPVTGLVQGVVTVDTIGSA